MFLLFIVLYYKQLGFIFYTMTMMIKWKFCSENLQLITNIITTHTTHTKILYKPMLPSFWITVNGQVLVLVNKVSVKSVLTHFLTLVTAHTKSANAYLMRFLFNASDGTKQTVSDSKFAAQP